MADFTTELRRLMADRGMSLRALARAAPCDPSHLSRVVNRKQPPSEQLAAALDKALGAEGGIIAAAREQPARPAAGNAATVELAPDAVTRAPGLPLAVLVQVSTSAAANLTVSAGRELIGPPAIEQYFDEVSRLAVVYGAATAGVDRRVLEQATALRGTLQKLTAAYRDPAQSSDLYLMIGLLSGICSYACLDLGYPDEAQAQAQAAFTMGDLAGHDGLRAWSMGTRSLIARFQGRYHEALGHARRGLPYATCGTSLVRLRCGEGQTLANLGDTDGAVRSLSLAKDAREQVTSPDVAGGLFTFTEAKQTYYSGSSLQWLSGDKHARAAEAESARAIAMFQASGPESRSLADELLAHVYLGNSRLTLGEVDGSLEALRPVLDLPAGERNSWQRKRMRQIAARLGGGRFADSATAVAARDEISSFVTDSGGGAR